MAKTKRIETNSRENIVHLWNSTQERTLLRHSLFGVGVLNDHDDDAVGELVDEAHEAVDKGSSFDVAADEVGGDGQGGDEEGWASSTQERRHQEDAPLCVVAALAEPHPQAAADANQATKGEGPLQKSRMMIMMTVPFSRWFLQ